MIFSDRNPLFRQKLNTLILRGIFALAVVSAVTPRAVRAEDKKAPSMNLALPQTLNGWTLSGPARRVETKAIFDYMDGAGELYLGYRFKFLDVYEYNNPGQSDILVELYWMDSADDAFGLLSGDWGGDAVDLSSGAGQDTPSTVRALYGAGLLRIWSGDLYARVLSYAETDASKQAVIAMGKIIVVGRPQPRVPGLIRALPQSVGSQFELKADRTVYLRSHLVLNSAYFLSSENLLNLG